jgi:acetate kinase
VLGRADAIAFTGGVGENSAPVRRAVMSGLGSLGIELDEARNAASETIISTDVSPITVCVVPTDEELEIAIQSARALAG